MEPFQIVMKVITTLLSIYSGLVFIRIMLSWIPIPQLERVKQILGSVVDPYLNQFRGISWLRFGMMDFSPVVGLILLSMVINITGRLANQQTVTLGYVLVILINSIWGFVSFILGILILLMVVRLVVSLLNGNNHTSWGNVDSMIYNVMARVVGLFTRKSVSFNAGLAITAGVFIILRIGVGFLISLLAGFLLAL